MVTDTNGYYLEPAPTYGRLLEDSYTPPEASVRPPVETLAPTSGIEALILKTFPDAPVMARVAMAESGYDPAAKNPKSTAKGVFQILDGSWKSYGCTGNVLNAADNIRCARKMYDESGLAPWESSRSKWGR